MVASLNSSCDKLVYRLDTLVCSDLTTMPTLNVSTAPYRLNVLDTTGVGAFRSYANEKNYLSI